MGGIPSAGLNVAHQFFASQDFTLVCSQAPIKPNKCLFVPNRISVHFLERDIIPKLKKIIHRLKDGDRVWQQSFSKSLSQIGFKSNNVHQHLCVSEVIQSLCTTLTIVFFPKTRL